MESTHLDVREFIIGLKAPITNRVKVEIVFGVYSSSLTTLLLMSKSFPPAGRDM